MPSVPYTVVAEQFAQPGKEEELKKHLLALVAPTRKEAGCLLYELHQDHSAPGHFVFFENWESKEALERHIKTPHMAAFQTVEKQLVAQPARVTFCARIS
jgi:quinol monooxygenase YgiN